MATVKKGLLTYAIERWVHLRKYNKHLFWKKERLASKKEINKEVSNG